MDVLQEVNKIDAYTQTKLEPQFLLEQTKKRLGVTYFLNFQLSSFLPFSNHFFTYTLQLSDRVKLLPRMNKRSANYCIISMEDENSVTEECA
jgi:hypothetical protein